MATLYGQIVASPAGVIRSLPAASELPPSERKELELGRLFRLLRILVALPELAESGLSSSAAVGGGDGDDWLLALNLAILKSLALADSELLLAYQLGRSLRETVSPPPVMDDASFARSADPVATQLERNRIATLQGWLAVLSARFSPQAAAVVAGSLGHWSDFASVTMRSKPTLKNGNNKAQVAETMRQFLLPQGELWLMLLVGTNSIAGLRRSQSTLRRVRRRSGTMLVLLAATVAAVFYLIVTYTSGAVSVLTSIATIAGALGPSAKGFASIIGSYTTKGETRPELSLAGEAEVEAMVWAITSLPAVRLTARGVRSLRRAGISGSGYLGRVDRQG
jgi:hypothetical protein